MEDGDMINRRKALGFLGVGIGAAPKVAEEVLNRANVSADPFPFGHELSVPANSGPEAYWRSLLARHRALAMLRPQWWLDDIRRNTRPYHLDLDLAANVSMSAAAKFHAQWDRNTRRKETGEEASILQNIARDTFECP